MSTLWIISPFSKRQRSLKKELDTCSMNLRSSQSILEFYEAKNLDIDLQLEFDQWGAWGSCEGGVRMRQRSKIASEGEGDVGEELDSETEEGCTEVIKC